MSEIVILGATGSLGRNVVRQAMRMPRLSCWRTWPREGKCPTTGSASRCRWA